MNWMPLASCPRQWNLNSCLPRTFLLLNRIEPSLKLWAHLTVLCDDTAGPLNESVECIAQLPMADRMHFGKDLREQMMVVHDRPLSKVNGTHSLP